MEENENRNPYAVLNADCLDAMKRMPDCCIDAIVTDPPYGLNFMGRNWDHGVPGVEFWKEALRVAKPGAHLLSFGGTRTFHRIACAIEDAGWEIRDVIMWMYGQGFPKSMDISKAIEKKTGDSETANKWNGWGTCLKPAYEPVIMARKPLEGTVVDTVLKYGTGGINIDGCRVPYESEDDKKATGMDRPHTSKVGALAGGLENDNERTTFISKPVNGRFPANVIHDGSDEVIAAFPDDTGAKASVKAGIKQNSMFSTNGTTLAHEKREETSTNAARFFYCAKASKSEKGKDNPHPTVKPLELMKYLIKMVATENALVLDPFMGSGSTGVAAIQIGRRFIGVEKETEYFNYAKKRIEDALQNAEKKV